MISLLWEDDHGAVLKNFGPHALLLGCLVDERGVSRKALEGVIQSHALRGNGNVVKALQKDLGRFSQAGPVTAILDSDQVGGLLDQPVSPHGCHVRAVKLFHEKYAGEYRVLLLERNVDTLVAEVCTLLSRPLPAKKATPNERDEILGKAAWNPARGIRDDIRKRVPTFNRLVARVIAQLPPA